MPKITEEQRLASEWLACADALRQCRAQLYRLIAAGEQVVQTRRLQSQGVLSYLQAALAAHRNGLPAPSLLAAD
jgi:hypothetical protein